MVNISFIKLKGNVTDNYLKTLSGWRSKDVAWEDVHKVMSSSKVQYSCYRWLDTRKSSKSFKRDKQNCIIIDVDDGMSIVDFQNMFKKYKYIIGTTKTHQKEKKGIVCDRFRVIIPCINIPEDDDVYFRMLELMFPFNDKQTLTKTASFLGCSGAIVLRNDGKLLDCFKASELAFEQIRQERMDKLSKVIDRDLLDYKGKNSIEELRLLINYEVVKDVIESCGYEFEGNKFRLREDERTPSCKVYPSGYIKDYGGEFSGDIFKLLTDCQDMSFRDAMNYVRNFV